MAFRKRTLRIMSPTARKVARLIGEIQSVANRLKNVIPELQSLELDSRALANSKIILQSGEAVMTFKDTDLWGLRDCLMHCQQDGYAKENSEWTQVMLNRINLAREKFQPVFEES